MNKMSTMTKSALMAAAMLLSIAVSAQAGGTYYSEFTGGNCTAEQEQQAIEASRIAQAQETTVHPEGVSESKYYSEFVGGNSTATNEQQAMEKSRIAQNKKITVTAAKSTSNCYFSEIDAAYVCK